MSVLDIAIVLILTLACAAGIYWGALRQALALTGLVAGLAVAGRYGGAAGDAMTSYIADPAVAAIVGYSIPFVAVSGGASFLASLLHLAVGLRFGGRLDSALGVILGACHALMLLTAMLILLQTHPANSWSPIVQSSILSPLFIQTFGGTVWPLLGIA